MRMMLAAGLAIAMSLSAQAQTQTPDIKSIPARVELHPIQSVTVSDQQFLNGDRAAGRPVTVSGELRVAQGSGRLPVVVLIHGSGGVGANVAAWVPIFNAMGVSTFVIDGFTGRGLVSTGTDQAKLGRLNLIVDIYEALAILAKHPRVDPARIALMGFSRGGQAALYASLDRFHERWNRSGIRFAAYIPFYPDCSTTFVRDAEIAAVPVRVFHGTPDDYNPVASCKAYFERLRAVGRDVVLTEYPNAPHGFDNPIARVPAVVATGSQTVRNCKIREADNGVLINAETQAPFTYQDACVQLGPRVGGDPEATVAARKAVTDFIKALFKTG